MNTIRILIRWTFKLPVSGLPNFYARVQRWLGHTAPERPITLNLVIHTYTNATILPITQQYMQYFHKREEGEKFALNHSPENFSTENFSSKICNFLQVVLWRWRHGTVKTRFPMSVSTRASRILPTERDVLLLFYMHDLRNVKARTFFPPSYWYKCVWRL